MKLAALIITTFAVMVTTLIAAVCSYSSVGIMASTTYSPGSDNRMVMLSLAQGHNCQKGDWVFSFRKGYVGRVSATLAGVALCEKKLLIGSVGFGDHFRIF